MGTKSNSTQSLGVGRLLAEARKCTRDFQALRRLWLTRNPERWANNTAAHRLVGERFLEFGEPLLAQDVFREILATSSNVRLKQLFALSLLRSGAEQSAGPLLRQLVAEGHRDEETLGLLARVEKGLAFSSLGGATRIHHLRHAFELYKASFRKTHGYWTGVNAATLGLVLGHPKEAIRLALRVREICERALARSGGRDSHAFWVLATLGEVSLILGNAAEAEANYARALKIGVHRIGDIASMRRNARMVVRAKQLEFPIDRVLNVPRVIAYCGERTSHPGDCTRSQSRKSLEDVRLSIAQVLDRKPAICFASGARGSEILFLEANRRNGGENYLVLPCPPKQFISESVDPSGENWVMRFNKLLKAAAGVLVLSRTRSSLEPIQIRFTDLLSLGHARLKATELDTIAEELVLWRARPGTGIEKHADSLTGSETRTVNVQIVPHKAAVRAARRTSLADAKLNSRKARKNNPFVPKLRAMLFADAVGFSKLSEAQLPAFFSKFQSGVAKLMRSSAHCPEVANTWGDGLYFVFRTVEDAGRFSLELRDNIRNVDWSAVGLPKSLSLRIGLHAGPVYGCRDPITGRPTFIGTNVTRAARLEPITPPGEVYTSAEFAALTAAENVTSLSCEYVGIIPAVKGYGDFPTYVLRSHAPA